MSGAQSKFSLLPQKKIVLSISLKKISLKRKKIAKVFRQQTLAENKSKQLERQKKY